MKPFTFNEFLHGADYNYEQWIEYPEVLEEDRFLMKKAVCNAMTIGIFSWSMLEPEDGVYRFNWLDDLMDQLHQSGIKAILATPSGSKPAWLSQKYPEVCRVDADGKRAPHGYRHNHCRSSPVYREKCYKLNTLLAERYKDHPALFMWHVSNEYNSGSCHCNLCQDEFREWLRRRYGSLENLNRAWWTTFWSHRFTDWEQISPGDASIHGLNLDWMRFISDQTLDFFRAESAPLREITPEIPITTNFMMPDVGLDYYSFAPYLSVISWDNYPRWHVDEKEWNEGVKTSFYHDLFRSMKAQPFMMMESSPDVTNWQGISIPKKGRMHFLSSLQAVAHGSDTVQYFQWRQSRGGEEKFHSAVVSHAGHGETRVFRNVMDVGHALKTVREISGTRTEAEVALIYDFQNEWALNLAKLPRNVDKCYQQRCIAHYRAFWQAGIPVDIVDSVIDDFSQYKIVVAPMLYMLREGFADNIRRFVKDGGVFVTTYLSGLVDESDLCFRGGAPGPLKDLLGLWIEETDIINDQSNQEISFDNNFSIDSSTFFKVRHYADVVHNTRGETIASYGNGFLENHPAVVRNETGKGETYYLAARLEDEFYTMFYEYLIDCRQLNRRFPGKLPEGVTVQYRSDKRCEFAFFMNFTPERREIPYHEPDDEDMLSGSKIGESLILEPYGTVIIRHLRNG